jgi:ubiquinone/menaquinone biosynthesis C-methylase UbiE
MTSVDVKDLESKVKDMYREVAENPQGDFHFEMGRALAERLGYDRTKLDAIPPESIESFAGVGHFFHLAALRPGENVVDLGSGSGMDTFIAAREVGPGGRVVGIDMTDAQRLKAERLRDREGLRQVEYQKAYIEELPLAAGIADCVISNGVINLSADKGRVFREAARVLKPGGRLAIADIVTDLPLPETVVCNATLWAACIGGAMQVDLYRQAIERAGLAVAAVEENRAYAFITSRAQGAATKYGVKSVSILARKPRSA